MENYAIGFLKTMKNGVCYYEISGGVILPTTELLAELKGFVKEELIKELPSVSHPLGNTGQLLVTPQSEEEISALLKYANHNKLSVSIIGGGTKRGFGGQNETADILLSLAQYKGVVEHTVGDMTLTVKAGTNFKALQDYLAPYHQKLALDPFWPEYATLGGIIATNDSGPKRLCYGSARDSVIGLRMIYPDGKIIRSGGKVVKNVAGYDMNKLFIGSMGTLGVISEVTVKLRPIAKCESLVLLSFPQGNADEIYRFAVELLDSVIEPVCLELLNPTISEKVIGDKSYTLAISFEDVESSVRYQEDWIRGRKPENAALSILPSEKAQVFWKEFYQTSPNGAFEQISSPTVALMKIGVVNLDVIKMIYESQLIADMYNVVIDAHGGLGHGLCQIHISGTDDDVVKAVNELRERAVQLGGYGIIKHLPFYLRQKVNVWGAQPATYFLLKGIKAKIDPSSILNKGRFVGGI